MENFSGNVNVEARAKVSVGEVLEVLAFSDSEIKLKLKDNSLLLINGVSLKILCFDNKSGNFTAVGKIEGVRFKGKQENFLKKVFK